MRAVLNRLASRRAVTALRLTCTTLTTEFSLTGNEPFSHLLKGGSPVTWVGNRTLGIFCVRSTPKAVAFLREIPVET